MFLKDCYHIISLVFADLRYEWILSLCMVLALGAIFSPLFILLGLQEGIVGNMLDKLQRDPVNRLITPRFPIDQPLNADWLKSLGDRTSLVITSPTARLLLDIEGNDKINAVPTNTQDPLLTENGIKFPEQLDSLVISERLANKLQKKRGDTVELILERQIGETERITHPFNLVGILPNTVTSEFKIWVHEQMFHDIYEWRHGKGLPSLNLPSKGGYLTPKFNGIATILEKLPSNKEYRRMLAGKLSFGTMPVPLSQPGWTASQGNKKIQLWKPVNSQVNLSAIQPLVNRHYDLGYSVETVPFIDEFIIKLTLENQNKSLAITVLPASLLPDSISNNNDLPIVYVSPNELLAHKDVIASISFNSGATNKKKISIPVLLKSSPNVNSGYIAVPVEFAGNMNAARTQLANYDPIQQKFISVSSSNRYFRAYAESINDIEAVVKFVRKHGNTLGINALQEPVSKLNEVHHLQKLSGYMTKLYLLIVLVAGVSGFFAIAASVYAGVERKRRDLAYLQLLGVNKWALFLFPYLKSQVLVVGGLIIAIITYLLFGYFADKTLAEALQGSDSLTRLSWLHSLILVAVTFLAASLASLIAAATVNRIEAGEIIH